MAVDIEELVRTLGQQFRAYDLQQISHSAMPVFQPPGLSPQPGFAYFLTTHHQSFYNPDKRGVRSSASGLVVMRDHVGTHIDAKCHQSYNLELPGGIRVSPDIETSSGFTKLGSEEIPPLVSRSVLIDVASKSKEDLLPQRYHITVEDCEKFLSEMGLKIQENDIVLVRTGYGRFWNEPEKYEQAAGMSKEVSAWLRDKRVLAVGADNLTWDAPGLIDPETRSSLPGHLVLLAKCGIYIMENLNLEDLSHDNVFKHLFIGLPIKILGATGSPLRPIAFSHAKALFE